MLVHAVYKDSKIKAN